MKTMAACSFLPPELPPPPVGLMTPELGSTAPLPVGPMTPELGSTLPLPPVGLMTPQLGSAAPPLVAENSAESSRSCRSQPGRPPASWFGAARRLFCSAHPGCRGEKKQRPLKSWRRPMPAPHSSAVAVAAAAVVQLLLGSRREHHSRTSTAPPSCSSSSWTGSPGPHC